MTILMSRCFIAPIPTCVRCATLPKRVCNTRGPNLKLNSVQVLPYRPRAALNRQDQSHSGKITHVAVLVSGGGRSLANLCERINLKLLTNVEICAVIASKSKAGAIGIAQRNGLPVHVICAKDYPSGASEHSTAITDVLRSYEPDLVIMAGWMHFYQIPAHFAGRVLNIHPSLIPAFCGKGFYGNKVHKAALGFGVKITGCTVHFADNEYDHGPIILQKSVPVYDEDTVEDLASRVFNAEKEALPEAIQMFADSRLAIDGRIVRNRQVDNAVTYGDT